MTNLETNTANRIGCHVWGHDPGSRAATSDFHAAGCRWIRSTRPMQMDIVCTAPFEFDFRRHGCEEAANKAIEAGFSIMGILDGRWWPEEAGATCNPLPFCSPIWEHLDQWDAFVRACVEFYKDRVKYWEVINEPPFFWWYPTPEGVDVSGENMARRRAPVSTYAQLLKTTYAAVKQTDPDAFVVVGSGFCDGLFLDHLYRYGCKDFFDIASVHYLNCRHPEDFGRAYRRVRQVMSEHGDGHKQLWDTESGPGGAVIGKAVETPAEYEGLYNVYRHCFAHQFDLERYFWFNPISKLPDGAHGGGVRQADGSFAPGYQAMKVLTDQVGEGQLMAHKSVGGECHAYVFRGPNGPVSILWATAPATVRSAQPIAAVDAWGQACTLRDGDTITGVPVYIQGNVIEGGLDVVVAGPRETVVPVRRTVDPGALEAGSPILARDLKPADIFWDEIPFLAERNALPIVKQDDHFQRLANSLNADVKIAHTDAALYLRVQTYDERVAQDPRGFIQLVLRDSDPGVAEWPYFTNGYCLITLWQSGEKAMGMRYEHQLLDEYPAGTMANVDVQISQEADGLLYAARIPWADIGPARPGKHNPFLLLMNFNRCDHALAVPANDHPEEWSHNWVDNFICKKPALEAWVEFR